MQKSKKRVFKRIYIEISNACNLSCSFCPESRRQTRYLSLDEMDKILTELQGHGNNIFLHVKGEPLYHPDFHHILKRCEKHGKKVNITTNGTLLKAKGLSILESSAVRLVNISLQSFESTGSKAAYDAYLNTVLNFIKEGLDKTNIVFELRVWNLDSQDIERQMHAEHALERIREVLGNDIPLTTQNTKGAGVKSKVFVSKGFEFQWPNMTHPFVADKGNCYGLRSQIGILSDGTVVPCCLDGEGVINLGNILENSFENILETRLSRSIAEGFENRKIVHELCKRCSYRETYIK